MFLSVLSETNDVSTGLLIEVWSKGMLWDNALGYHWIPLPVVKYSNEVTHTLSIFIVTLVPFLLKKIRKTPHVTVNLSLAPILRGLTINLMSLLKTTIYIYIYIERERAVLHTHTHTHTHTRARARGCIQKFPDEVNNEIYTYLWYYSLRSNTKGYGGNTR
jgi:hypothetical protein